MTQLQLCDCPPNLVQRVELELEGVSQVSNPSSMEITVESSAFFRSPPTQKIELFDYESNGFVEVDTRNASPFDSVVTVSPAGSIERFIQPSTGLVKARLSYRQPTGRSSGFSVGIDHVFWHIE